MVNSQTRYLINSVKMQSHVIKVFIWCLLLTASSLRSKALATSPIDKLKEVSPKYVSTLISDGPKEQVTDQVAEPTTTSIHQVWTSSSSGSLEELSPEMISKLRGDVPFLAAYATRPRLINGAAISLRPVSSDSFGVGTQMQPPANLQVGASSEVQTRTSQAKTAPELSKLGNFNEFKIETSSSSRSEHTHKRSTSLKRKVLDEHPRKKMKGNANRLLEGRRAKFSIGRKSKRRQKSPTSHTNRLRKKKSEQRSNKKNPSYHLGVIRHGRYQDGPSSLQSADDKSANDPPATDTQSTGVSRQDGTKGGSGAAAKKPFYKVEDGTDELGSNKGRESNSPSSPESPDTADDIEEIDENPDDEPAGTATPKRVGDGDVDELEGDTVMVEPKSDGVDDDPELPDEGLPEDPNSFGDGREGRTDPNEDGDETETRAGDRESNGDGAGGATAGGGGLGGAVDMSPGVTFANEDEKSHDEGASDVSQNRPGQDRRSGIGSKSRDQDGIDTSDDDEPRKKPLGDKNPDVNRPHSTVSKEAGSKDVESDSNSSGRPEDDESGNDVDLDYRDEAEDERHFNSTKSQGKKTGVGEQSPEPKDCPPDERHHDHHDHHHHHDTIKWLEEAVPGKPGVDYPTLSSVNTSNFNCRDQKHPGYYADVETRCQVFHICQADGRQDSFLCPNGTIFSQITTVCVWWNSFDCEDAPQYYSLNALLYKSKSGSAHTDSQANDGSQSHPGRRLNGVADLRPRDHDEPHTSEENSSLDTLVRSMHGNKDRGADSSLGPVSKRAGRHDIATDGSSFLGDDSLTQKKANSISSEADEDDSPSQINSSARIRDRAIPRRRRRASVKQAPPKLKSRRVLRNSRRRKLRHGPPKRRS